MRGNKISSSLPFTRGGLGWGKPGFMVHRRKRGGSKILPPKWEDTRIVLSYDPTKITNPYQLLPFFVFFVSYPSGKPSGYSTLRERLTAYENPLPAEAAVASMRVRQVTPRATTLGTPKGAVAPLYRGKSPPH
jgi:hypothetical protein